MLSSGPKWTWMASNGGPLLLVPGEYLSSWGGVGHPPNGRHIEAQFRWSGLDEAATDYDRACDVTDYLGLLDIDTGQGLILGGEPLSTTWQTAAAASDDDAGGLVIRWVYVNSETDVIAALEHVPQSTWQDESLVFSVRHQPLYLLDAASPGGELQGDDHLTIHLPAGIYSIATAEYEPDDHTSLILHRLTRISGGPVYG